MHLEAGRDLATIYPVWKRNAEFVRAQNSLKLPYTVSMNKFGHLVNPRIVRFVLLQPRPRSARDLCEVQVYGLRSMNYIALKKADLGVIQSHILYGMKFSQYQAS